MDIAVQKPHSVDKRLAGATEIATWRGEGGAASRGSTSLAELAMPSVAGQVDWPGAKAALRAQQLPRACLLEARGAVAPLVSRAMDLGDCANSGLS